VIQVRAVSHSYGATRALEQVSLDVPKGAVLGLVGPNGAGKTTLIRAIATVLRQTSGHINVAGCDALRQPARARAALGFLPERANPYPDLLAWEHLDLFARIAGHRGAELARRVDQALEAAGLPQRRDARCGDLSKGLRQRLALQAALLHDPQALVLDEPSDGLDPDSRAGLLAEVRELATGGVAVLLSSHVLAELEQVADEVVILSKGAVATQATEAAGLCFTLRTRQDPQAALQLLQAQPTVAQAILAEDAVELRLAEDIPDAAEAVAALVSAGFFVVEVRPRVASLQERYRAAVDGEEP